VVAIFAKVDTDANAEDEEDKDFSVRKGYTKKIKTSLLERAIPYHMNCLRCLSLMMHPFDCAVVSFY
jgi:hypothetical protein